MLPLQQQHVFWNMLASEALEMCYFMGVETQWLHSGAMEKLLLCLGSSAFKSESSDSQVEELQVAFLSSCNCSVGQPHVGGNGNVLLRSQPIRCDLPSAQPAILHVQLQL